MACSFAYGSAVFKQANSSDSSLVDLILCVRNPQEWHKQNLSKNPAHYSKLASKLGPKTIENLQRNIGGRIYYNINAKHKDISIKYGVICIDDLVEDLKEWDTLYVAGRLHKPIVMLKGSEDMELIILENRRFALRTALLLLPKRFSLLELLEKIVGLSYKGDFRMAFGENPFKVKNIVIGQGKILTEIFLPIIMEEKLGVEGLGVGDSVGTSVGDIGYSLGDSVGDVSLQGCYLSQSDTLEDRERLILGLPSGLKERLLSKLALNEIKKLDKDTLSRFVEKCIKEIVYVPALTQAAKGVLSAGILASGAYALRKVSKYLKNLRATG